MLDGSTDFTKPEEILRFLGAYTKEYVEANPKPNPEHAKAVASLCKAALDAHYVIIESALGTSSRNNGWRMQFGRAV